MLRTSAKKKKCLRVNDKVEKILKIEDLSFLFLSLLLINEAIWEKCD